MMRGLALERWRDYFRTSNSEMFDIIDHAIMVAALDCPKDGWKGLVDEWFSATDAIVNEEGTPESMNPSVVDEVEEEGLPFPPLDEGAFFATQPTSMELSQFFDGMDDDGSELNFLPSVHLFDTFAIWRPPKNNAEQKSSTESRLLQTPDKMAVPKKPLGSQQDKFKTSDELSVQQKLGATKRKLQERYEQAENAKRKRTIQVMELHDLPKQGSSDKNHNRHRVNGGLYPSLLGTD
ncbi:Transcription elongation factor family protein, putative isoform 2 [Hibiscus syriacus]|uniref:Transcription elongation factor family protein, putative isoform 2 n=1 Tax=Hibiscus syriacus TaxID=106335 RepID=A0A6A3CCL3_HIBSY|nr:Transcription elongation factor family protein, putative isoform 2 [Hibiscus syriacus]